MIRRFWDWLFGRSVTKVEVVVHVEDIQVWVHGEAGRPEKSSSEGVSRSPIEEGGSTGIDSAGSSRFASDEDTIEDLSERLRKKDIPIIPLGRENTPPAKE